MCKLALVATGSLEENCEEAFAEARAKGKGYVAAGGEGLGIRLDAIENAVLNLARALDELARRGYEGNA